MNDKQYILKIKHAQLRGGTKVSKEDFDNPKLTFKGDNCCKVDCEGIAFFEFYREKHYKKRWKSKLKAIQKENGFFEELLKRGDIYEEESE